MNGRHVRAALDRSDTTLGLLENAGIEERRISRNKYDRAEADNEGEDVEVTDETGRIEDRLACGLRVLHREEAHQDMRQPCRTEHQSETERNRRKWIGDQAAGLHDRGVLWVHFGGLGEQRFGAEAVF